MQKTTPCWGVFELTFTANSGLKNPFDVGYNVNFQAEFAKDNRKLTAFGFHDGQDANGQEVYKIRFMPDSQGEWTFQTSSDIPALDNHKGSFTCTTATPNNHGPARVNGRHFTYADNTPLYPIGTTSYAWVHQPKALRDQTLESLKQTKFKKMRMCVFPKHYDFNHNEPEIYPYAGNLKEGFDYTRPNPAYYNLLEECIQDLATQGIEADLILFHAYDHWGFAKMDADCNHRYLRYVISRLAAYPNIWWSLANEYDLLRHLDTQDWEGFARIIQETDHANHLLSIHNCFGFYNHSRPWITHASIQRQDVYKTTEYTNEWLDQYDKPATLDEIGYEGDINWGWGNLTAQELTRRAWEGYVRGGYPGHGETYLSEDEVLWWSKGGQLKGESHARFSFITQMCEETGPISYLPKRSPWDLPIGGVEGKVYIAYFGFSRPRFRDFYSTHPYFQTSNLPEGNYKVEIIDTWEMTITDCGIMAHDKLRVDLPGRQYMAVRFTKWA